MNDLVENIKLRMSQKKWNNYDLERASGVPQSTIFRILKGKHADPRTSTIKKLAAGLGTTEMELRSAFHKADLIHIKEIGAVEEDKAYYSKPTKTKRIPLTNWQNLYIFLNSNKKYKELEIMPTNKVKVSSNGFMVEIDHDKYPDYLKKGDIIIVDPEKPLVSDSRILVTIGGTPHIMGYHLTDKEYVYHIRPGSSDISMCEIQDFKIIGQLVWIVPAGREA